jgi:L-lactate dehydrogenase complex protein LldG
MEDSTSREKILKKIRKALIHKSKLEPVDIDFDSAIYSVDDEPLEIMFAQKLTALNGKFVFCENEDDFISSFVALVKEHNWDNIFTAEPAVKLLLNKGKLPFSDKEADFLKLNVGITFCENLVARTGTVMITSRQLSGRRLPVYPHYHIVLAYTSQLLLTVKEALKAIKDKYGNQQPSMIAAISGPSRTADIEKTLVQGAHGPKEIFVFLVDDSH